MLEFEGLIKTPSYQESLKDKLNDGNFILLVGKDRQYSTRVE